MADSVDRVFSHALNTVNKIRTGSQKPPSTTRLRLYGLYKQAMEGDVDGIMDRPAGSSEQDLRAREKWDAWKQQNNLSRTEAKRRYITTLIDTMHQYASPSPDSRELVAELEFVWDQVKSNVPSSSSSSPLQTLDQVGNGMSASYSALERQRASRDMDEYSNDDENHPLQIKSPMSQSEEDLEAAEAEIDHDHDHEQDAEEFVDAPDSQYALDLYRRGAMDHNLSEAASQPPSKPPPRHPQRLSKSQPTSLFRRNIDAIATQGPATNTPTPRPRMRTIIPQPIPLPPSHPDPPASTTPAPASAADLKWRKRIESALQRQTAEIAALREQLEARRLFQHRVHYRFFRLCWRVLWGAVKHVAIDLLVLAVVMVVLRRRGERRAEGAVRVLLGDAVAQVREGFGGRVPALPALPGLPKMGGLGKKGG